MSTAFGTAFCFLFAQNGGTYQLAATIMLTQYHPYGKERVEQEQRYGEWSFHLSKYTYLGKRSRYIILPKYYKIFWFSCQSQL